VCVLVLVPVHMYLDYFLPINTVRPILITRVPGLHVVHVASRVYPVLTVVVQVLLLCVTMVHMYVCMCVHHTHFIFFQASLIQANIPM